MVLLNRCHQNEGSRSKRLYIYVACRAEGEGGLVPVRRQRLAVDSAQSARARCQLALST